MITLPSNPRLWRLAKRAISYLFVSASALLFLIPFIWMVSSSLQTEQEIASTTMRWIPETFHWENYANVFKAMPLWTYFKNSIFVTGLFIIGTLLSSSLVAYAFSVLKWPGRDKIFILVLATMMLPMQVTMIPVFVLYKELGWLNTFKPLIVPAFFGGGAFNIFLLRQFFLTIPRELFDSARIDGCTEFQIYWRIVLPLAKPALATVGIMTFLFTWNDFLGPLIYLSDKMKSTMALGIVMFVGQHKTEWALLMVASVLMMLPVILLFLFFQRYFIRGFMMSGIKG